MNGRNDDSMNIDRSISRSICDAVGERLRKRLQPDMLQPCSHLEYLMDELRRQDAEGRAPN